MPYKNFILIISTALIICCKPDSYEEPFVSLEDYHITDGFELQVVASEPFLEAPVAMDFDHNGRMWVVEMKGYMQNLEGSNQDMPNGTISILEDLDNDGITDHSKVFIDHLVLPRAIAHVYGGLLYAEPPNLWFVDIKNDKPLNKVLVDSLYSDGGNVEHQPNGLMMNIDNWIYNAKSNFRYQRKHGKWIKEPTSFRGQWGISKDNFGRLYYNNNSTQLIGDYVLPNTVIKNKFFNPNASINNKLTQNQSVYPLHPTSVNRGYSKGVLDKDSLLLNVTSSCGPLIYRGNQYPKSYLQNAFVCAPEANIVKRNILSFSGDKITAKQAWDNKEFIASTDEGFRPVNLFNGPDGNMYIVDMHRGIIQDKAYLSPYLKNHLAKKKLDTIIGMGRILSVVKENSKRNETPNIEGMAISELVDLLKNSNGWLRDKAQQLLIYKGEDSAIQQLKTLVLNTNNSLAQVHALHTLNGLNALSFNFLEKTVFSDSKNSTIAHALVLLEQFASKDHIVPMLNISEQLRLKKDKEINLYLGLSLGEWVKISDELFFPFLNKLSKDHQDNSIFQESILSSLRDSEEPFITYLKSKEEYDTSLILTKLLNSTITKKSLNTKNHIFVSTSVNTDARTAGYNIFRNLCAACHGVDGNGIENVAPPLHGSEYVEGAVDRLALIILHGLEGPVHVNGKLYELDSYMPGLANNLEYTDEDIANLISYMHNAFPNKSKSITAERIKILRDKKPSKGKLFTEEELLKIKY